MKVVSAHNARRIEPEPGWHRASLCNEEGVSVEHFVKPPGHASPLHQHPNAQVCVVIEGTMVMRTEDGVEQRVDAPGAAYFPPDEPHAVINPLDTPSVGIEVFVPGRSFDFWLERMRSGR
jgi:quercetin dioxygenase-like cupin family protein